MKLSTAVHDFVTHLRMEGKARATIAESTLKARMAAYEQEQERRRREAEEAARREQERLEREERERAAAEEARLRREAEDRQLADAAAAEAAGDTATARRIIEAPVAAPTVTPAPVFVPPAPVAVAPRVDGVSFRVNWRAEIVDLKALVQAVAAGRAPAALVKADEVALNGMARSLKGAMQVPGVRVVNQRTAAVRA